MNSRLLLAGAFLPARTACSRLSECGSICLPGDFGKLVSISFRLKCRLGLEPGSLAALEPESKRVCRFRQFQRIAFLATIRRVMPLLCQPVQQPAELQYWLCTM